MLIGSVLAVALAVLLQVFREPLNDAINLDPGAANLGTLVLIGVVWLAWTFWILFASGWAWGSRLLLGAFVGGIPAILAVLFQPIFDGDLGVVGFQSRFVAPTQSFTPVSVRDPSVAVEVAAEPIKSTEFDFPQFLGPNRDATIQNVSLASDWKAHAPKVEWKITIGEGWSGFVVVGDRAFTQEQRGAEECVTCYDVESGELLWNYGVDRRHEDLSAMGRVGPRATPTVHLGRVYAVGATGVLDCLDAVTGQPVWSVDVPALVGIEPVVRTNSNGYEYTQETSSLMWGRSTSPLIYNDMVVVPAGGPVGGTAVTMIAFDVEDGQERWRGGERNASYGSPSLITVAGQVQIALVVENAAVGHDPDTGQQLWSHPWVGNSDSNASCSQVTPLANEDGAGGMVLLSKGYGIGGEVVRLKRDENGWTAEQQQRNPRVLKTKFTNPVIVNGHAYSLSSGFLECTEVPSLQRRWKKRGRFGNGQLLLVGDKLLVHSESGTLTLVQVNPEKYQPLGRCKTIEGVCWNTLCLSGDRLLVRSEREAAMIRLPLESRPSQNVDTLSLP